ncbi:cell division protein FtsQ/DivIB [Citricoccus sp. NR2]|uniref:cell division protein FtsQ/DivIB n=1 Tax=Citricoccus sp. NR2 TaxID=3004095 RepID=UPI0022DE95D8|nr:cell division protein FtsQ/DivIB [Citricoccus sp. NR2]WBL18117.1 cell division protein FtsQ/DivIB [Citricoccus sp. NR2]
MTHRSDTGTSRRRSEPITATASGLVQPRGPEVVSFPETERERRRRLRRKGYWAGGIVVLLLAVLAAVVYFSPLLAIKHLRIDGTDLLPVTQAQSMLEPVVGQPLPQVGDDTVSELLKQHPAVDSVTTRAEPPDTLVVDVHEHPPVAMAPTEDDADGNSQYVLFNTHGTELTVLSASAAQPYDLPVVSSAEDVTDPELFNTITEVLGGLPEDILKQVRSASGETVDSVVLSLHNGRTVLWGNAEDSEQKAAVLTALLTIEDDPEEPVSEYDVSTPDHPVTR